MGLVKNVMQKALGAVIPYGTNVAGGPALPATPRPTYNIPGPGYVTPDPHPAYAFEYSIGYNYQWRPRGGYAVTYPLLRKMANNCDLVRIAIQMRKDQVRGLDWDVTVKPGYDPRALEPARQRMRDFFLWPDTLNDMNFNDWLSRLLEDILILDAGCIVFHKDRAQRLLGMTQIDGATVKPFMDQYGFVPMDDNPAYGQVLFGRIVGTFTRDELLYMQYNPQSDSPYGKPPVEMVLTSAHLSLRRQLSQLTYHTDGNIPDYIIQAPAEWNTAQIRQVQEYLDSYLSGSSAARHKMKLVPGGMGAPKELKQPDFTTQVDEWLARIIGAAFGVAPFLLLKQKESSRAQAQTVNEQQADIGLNPLKKFLAETFTTRIIHQRFKLMGLQFTWLSEQRLEEELNLQRSKSMIPVGALGIDEMRQAEGKAAIGVPPYIMTPNGNILFLTEKVKNSINSGQVDFLTATGGMDITAQPNPSGGSNVLPPGKHILNVPKPGNAATSPPYNTPDAPALPQDADDLETIVVDSADVARQEVIEKELARWRRTAVRDLKEKGVIVLKDDVATHVPSDRVVKISEALLCATTVDDIMRAFA